MENGKYTVYTCPICDKSTTVSAGLGSQRRAYAVIRSSHLRTHGINTAEISPEHRDDPEFIRKYYAATHVAGKERKPILGTDRLLSAEEAVKIMKERGYEQMTDSHRKEVGEALIHLAEENKIRVWLWRDGQLKFQIGTLEES